MEKKILKIFSLLLISMPLLLIPSDNSEGCGWYPEPDDYYTIFENALFDLPLLKPFFLSENNYFPYEETGSLGERTDNLREWLKYFNNIPTIDDIESIVYPTSKEEIMRIIEYLKTGKDLKLNDRIIKNSLITYLFKNKKNEVPEYLLFAKECEPHVVKNDSWEEIIRDSSAMTVLIQQGEEKYSSCSDKFLKERYAYQIIRLAHYSKQYEKAISLYEKYFVDNDKTLIQNWALSHKAGCLRKLNRVAEANYIFSKLFDTCPSRSMVGTASFVFLNDSLLEKTLQLCRSDHEKTAVYTIASYKAAVDLESLEHIYELEPKSKFLELLLSREISRMEREVLPAKYSGSFNIYFEMDSIRYTYYDPDYNRSVFRLVSNIANNNNCMHPYLWHFAAAYMASLVREENLADAHFIEAKRLCPKEDLNIINRIKIVELISKISRIRKIDHNIEYDLLEDMKWLTQNDNLVPLHSKEAYIYIMYLLANKYYAQGDFIKAHLCIGTKDFPGNYNNIYSPFSYDIHSDYYKQPVDELLNYIQGKYFHFNENFEDFLIRNYILDENDLREIEGTQYLSQYRYKDAEAKFKEISNYYWTEKLPFTKNHMYFGTNTLPADPFEIHINDCHDCDYQADKKSTYNKLTFAQRMIELENLAQTDKQNSAQCYFLLGNAYYNMTYYGNNWSSVSYYRNIVPRWYGKWDKNSAEPSCLYDCSKAQELYLMAMSVTKDKEFAARCSFMAAKCEQNKFYNEAYDWNKLHKDPDEFRKEKLKFRNFFRILVEKYSDTKFYKEALAECKYFNEFVTKQKN